MLNNFFMQVNNLDWSCRLPNTRICRVSAAIEYVLDIMQATE